MGGSSMAEAKDTERKNEEVDITEKVQYFLKYGVLSIILLALLCAGIMYFLHFGKSTMTVYDAKVESQLVGVKSKAAGKVTEILVEDGDHVEAGQVIARVAVNVTEEDIRQLEQTVELSQKNLEQLKQGQTITVPTYESGGYNPAAQQNLASAAARMQRMNELYEMGAISAMKRDEAAAEYAAAQAAAAQSSAPAASYRTMTQPTDPKIIEQAELQLKQAQAALNNAKQDSQATEIVAPVAGTLYYTDIKVDSEVKPGQTIVRIGDAGNLWLEARLTADQLEKVRLGQYASYEVDGHELSGTVQEIQESSAGEQETAANTEPQEAKEEGDGKQVVKISVPADLSFNLRPGVKASVRFSLDS